MVDRYTKAVLTVIAACLVWNVVHDMVGTRPASAQSGGPLHVIVDSVGQFAFQYTTVPVRMQN